MKVLSPLTLDPAVKLVQYSLMGLLSVENMATSVVLMPLAPLGVKAGRMILEKVRQDVMYRFCILRCFYQGYSVSMAGSSNG